MAGEQVPVEEKGPLMPESGGGSAQEAAAVLDEPTPFNAGGDGRPRTAATLRLGAAEIRRQEELVLRAKAGEPDALSQLHAEHAERVYRYFIGRVDGRQRYYGSDRPGTGGEHDERGKRTR